jgi:hypothetical protein
MVLVEIKAVNGNLLMASTYFQFSEPTLVHAERLEKMARENGGKRLVVGGDVNARSTLWEDTHTDERGMTEEETMMASDLYCCNVGGVPTFCTAMGSAVLDVMFASTEAVDSVREWAVDTTSAMDSDHRLICFKYQLGEKMVEKRDVTGVRFKVRQADWNKFRQKLAEELFNGRSSWLESDLHSRADYLTQSLTKACRASMPKVKPRELRRPEWFTSGLVELRRKIRRARRELAEARLGESEELRTVRKREYRRVRNKYTSERRR